MTDKSYTHILSIVDRSGSMAWRSADKEMASALTAYFKTQAEEEGTCLVDYVQFDNVYEKVYEDRPAYAAEAVIRPRNGTALLDAIGRGATELGAKLRALPESRRPGTVLVVVVTDGAENSSIEWTGPKVKELIKRQEDKYNWQFVFLGANIDAEAVGNLYGFDHGRTMTFDIGNAAAVAATMDSVSTYSSVTRGGGSYAFSDEERKTAVGVK